MDEKNASVKKMVLLEKCSVRTLTEVASRLQAQFELFVFVWVVLVLFGRKRLLEKNCSIRKIVL